MIIELIRPLTPPKRTLNHIPSTFKEKPIDNVSIYLLFNQEHPCILSYQLGFLMTCEISCTVCVSWQFLICINLSNMLLHRKEIASLHYKSPKLAQSLLSMIMYLNTNQANLTGTKKSLGTGTLFPPENHQT
jgi:hypothetical protein